MRIQVRKCPFTGEIFEEKDIGKYILHLKELRDGMREEREHARIRKTWEIWLDNERAKVLSVEDIPAWFLRNQRKIMDACNAIAFAHRFDERNKFVKQDEFIRLGFETFPRFEKLASNSHVCPRGGVTNWCAKDKDKPVGYPGFRGYIRGSLKRPANRQGSYPYAEALNLVGIRTGTGGGGNENFGYDFTIFLAEWPGIAQQLTVDVLKGTV